MAPENAARQPTQHAGLTHENAEQPARVIGEPISSQGHWGERVRLSGQVGYALQS